MLKNRTKSSDNAPDGDAEIRAGAIIIVAVILVALGIIAISWFLINGLQETSHNLRTNKVKPQQYMSDMVLVDMGEKYEALSTQGSHPGVKKLSQEAVSLGNAGKTEQAIAKITEANKLLRKEIGTRQAQPLERAQLGFNEWLMATYLWNLHKADDAFSLINQAIKDDPMKSESYRFRAQIYEAQGKLDLAQADREKGKRIDESFLNGRDVAGSWSQTLRKEQEPMRHISR